MERVVDILVSQYEYDIGVFTNPWMYLLIVPIAIYIPFFIAKWALLTLPAWLPISLILGALKIHVKE